MAQVLKHAIVLVTHTDIELLQHMTAMWVYGQTFGYNSDSQQVGWEAKVGRKTLSENRMEAPPESVKMDMVTGFFLVLFNAYSTIMCGKNTVF